GQYDRLPALAKDLTGRQSECSRSAVGATLRRQWFLGRRQRRSADEPWQARPRLATSERGLADDRFPISMNLSAAPRLGATMPSISPGLSGASSNPCLEEVDARKTVLRIVDKLMRYNTGTSGIVEAAGCRCCRAIPRTDI